MDDPQTLTGATDAESAHPLAFGPLLTRAELAERAGTSLALLDALERDGLLIPMVGRSQAGQRAQAESALQTRYAAADAETLSAAMTLLEAGVPLDELLHLARRHHAAMLASADLAVELFVRFVVDPIRESAASQPEADQRLADALEIMLPATNRLIAKHFERLLVVSALERVDRDEDAGGEPAA